MLLGKYEIQEVLGRGGFGTVYKGYDKVLDRTVAVKVLHPNLVNDPTFLARFQREAQIAAKLDHPNIVPVYDFGEAEGHYYIVMGYMPGGSLKDRLSSEGPSEKSLALSYISQIGEGLDFAHSRNVIHRDLKPGNILFDERGKVRVSDMGFAKLLHSDTSMSMTVSGGIVGTPAYMAPEIWNGKPATAATDVYSVACILVEMLIGSPLFEGETTPMIMKQHFEPLNLPEGLPEEWKPVFEAALAKEPENRLSTMADFVEALRYAEENPDHAKQAVSHARYADAGRVEVQKNTKGTATQTKSAPQPPAKPKRALLYGGLALLLLVAGFLVWQLGSNNSKASSQNPQTNLGSNLQEDAEYEDQIKDEAVVNDLIPVESSPTVEPSATPEPSVTPEITSTLGIGSTKVREIDGMEMVYVPEGDFEMGSTLTADSQPVRNVFLDAYWIDKFEVSNGQYATCVEAGACTRPKHSLSFRRTAYYGNEEYLNYPVVYVDWYQAQDYCQWAGGELPTEAQWEKAGRGSDGRLYPWGNDEPSSSFANYEGKDSSETMKVGSKPKGASPYGALDMSGNVKEWIFDSYEAYDSEELLNPKSTVPNENKVVRGGAYGKIYERCYSYGNWYCYTTRDQLDGPSIVRLIDREKTSAGTSVYNIGFRCAYPVDEP